MPLRLRSLFVAFLAPLAAHANPAPEVVPLWANGAPGFEGLRNEPEQAHDYWVRNVNNPSVTAFMPAKGTSNGCAVLVVPGGGFKELVFDREGKEPSEFLNGLGVTAFALKYRLPGAEHSPYTMDNVRQDAYRAIRLIRSRAAEFNVDPNRIGILGFSVGGAMAMMVSFDKGSGDPAAPDPVDRVSGRPNFEMIVYPGKPEYLPKIVPPDTGPAFLLCANDDQYQCDEVTLALLERFRAAKVPVEALFVAKGKHGFNMGERSEYLSVRHWPDRMADWLGDRGLLKPTPQ